MSVESEKSSYYTELGVDPRSTTAEIAARIAEDREQSNRLKRIPKRSEEASARLAHLAEIERVLLEPGSRAIYDAGLREQPKPKPSAPASKPEPKPEQPAVAQQKTPEAPRVAPPSQLPESSCRSCGAEVPKGANFCEHCGTAVQSRPANISKTAFPASAIPQPVSLPSRSDTAKAEAPQAQLRNLPQPPIQSSNRSKYLLLAVPILVVVVLGGLIWISNIKQRSGQPLPITPNGASGNSSTGQNFVPKQPALGASTESAVPQQTPAVPDDTNSAGSMPSYGGENSQTQTAPPTATQPAQSYSVPSSPEVQQPAPAAPIRQAQPASAAPSTTSRAPHWPVHSAASEGYITWTGLVDQKGTVTIDGPRASTGQVDGELPGVPVVIDLDTKNYALVEYPSAANGWKRFTIRSKNKRQAIILKWELAGR